MVLEGLGLYEWAFIVIGVISQTVVLTTWLTRMKFRIDYLEKSFADEIKASKEVHEALKQEIKELKQFFVDWLQRLENVTRDTPSFHMKKMQDVQQGENVMIENKHENNIEIEKKLDTLIYEIRKINKSSDSDKRSV